MESLSQSTDVAVQVSLSATSPTLDTNKSHGAEDPAITRAASCISVDLVSASRQLINLLIAVDTWPHGGLYDGLYVREAIRRYELHWLPMLARMPEGPDRDSLIPPLDVAYAWLCHRLNPLAYKADCIRLFGKELRLSRQQALAFGDGSLGSSTAHLAARINTKKLWGPDKYFPPSLLSTTVSEASGGSKKYDADTIDAAVNELSTGRPSYFPTWESKLSYDLAAAMSRQGRFLHNVLRAAYNEEPFLQRAVDRYIRYLVLWHESPAGTVLVPMFDIDLVWHAHMACTRHYVSDLADITGSDKVLQHDDAMPEGDLATGYQATKAAYEKRFDMLYDPPLTTSVPHNQRHPAEAVVGTQLLGMLGPPSIALLRLRAKRARVSKKLTEARNLISKARSERKSVVVSKKRYQKSAASAEKALAELNALRAAAETLHKDIQSGRQSLDIPARQQRNGGHALVMLYFMQRALAKQHNSLSGRLLKKLTTKRYMQMQIAKAVVKRVTAIKAFDPHYAPFRSDHPFFLSRTLLPYDSPNTMWRTPPGSAPGTLRAALLACKVIKSGGMLAIGHPVSFPTHANLNHPSPATSNPPGKLSDTSSKQTLPNLNSHGAQSSPLTGRARMRQDVDQNSSRAAADTYYPIWAFPLAPSPPPDQPGDPGQIGIQCPDLGTCCPSDMYPDPGMAACCCNPGFCPYDICALGGELGASSADSQVALASQQLMVNNGDFNGLSDCVALASAMPDCGSLPTMDTTGQMTGAVGDVLSGLGSSIPGMPPGATCGGACAGSVGAACGASCASSCGGGSGGCGGGGGGCGGGGGGGC